METMIRLPALQETPIEKEMEIAIKNDCKRTIELLEKNYEIDWFKVFKFSITTKCELVYFKKYVLSKYKVKFCADDDFDEVWNYYFLTTEDDKFITGFERPTDLWFSEDLYPYIQNDLKKMNNKSDIVRYLLVNTSIECYSYNFVDCFKDVVGLFEMVLRDYPRFALILLNYTNELKLAFKEISKYNIPIAFDIPFKRHLESMDGVKRITDPLYLEKEKFYLNLLEQYVPSDIAKLIWWYVEIV